jgi:hypothetical protein
MFVRKTKRSEGCLLSLVRLGALKQLTLAHLKGLKKMRDHVALSVLGTLKVKH